MLGDQRELQLAERAVCCASGCLFPCCSYPQFFFTSDTPSPATTAVASLLLQILSMNIPSLLGDHLLGGLQSLEHVLRILLKQTHTDAVGTSEDFNQSVVALVEGENEAWG